MKLAEALLLRSEYTKKIENLQHRLLSNVKIQENDKPFENPQTLIKEIFQLNEDMYEIIKRINKCNASTKMDDGLTLDEAIARRNMLIKKRSTLSLVANKATERDHRFSHSEIKMNVTISIADMQKQIDELSKEYRELDTKIQTLNWTTELQ